MNNERQNNYNESYISSIELGRYTSKVFGWTFLGLMTTAIVVMLFIYGIAVAPDTFGAAVMGAINAFFIVSIVQIVLVMSMSARIYKMRPATAKILYLFYAASMGIFFTAVTLTVALPVIGTAFMVTAVTFGIMAVYGVTTKQDLTRFGNILMMGLIGMIVAIVINLFLGNDMLDMLITIVGIFLFLALTVYDTNRIRQNYYRSLSPAGEPTDLTENLAIFSALGLYLNFVNLFMYILRFLNRD